MLLQHDRLQLLADPTSKSPELYVGVYYAQQITLWYYHGPKEEANQQREKHKGQKGRGKNM